MTNATLRSLAVRFGVVASVSTVALVGLITPVAVAAPSQGAVVVSSEQISPLVASNVVAAAPAPVVMQTRNQLVAVQTEMAPASSARQQAVEFALSKVGSPYRWGATGPSAFDCSGLVAWAFGQAGIDVPRTSRAQSQTGTPVSRSNLQPGDLVFFYSPVSHVGIYIGNGQMVHASTSGKPVAIAPIDGRQYNSARRL